MTTIRVSKETQEMLKNIGKKGETYDDVIRRLIEFYIEHGADSTQKEGGDVCENK